MKAVKCKVWEEQWIQMIERGCSALRGKKCNDAEWKRMQQEDWEAPQ